MKVSMEESLCPMLLRCELIFALPHYLSISGVPMDSCYIVHKYPENVTWMAGKTTDEAPEIEKSQNDVLC